MKHKTFTRLSIFMSLLLLLHIFMPTGFVANAQGIQDDQTAEGDYGMVVTAHPLASEVGADVLKKGGNAIDAAVAIQFALNVNEPMMSGIGGGGFLMYYDAETEEVSVINSRERAPAGATPDMFLDEDGNVIPFQERVRSGKSVGVPGTLKGLETALDQWGTRSMEELLESSIEMAEEGVEVNWVLANAIASNEEKLSNTAAKEVFLPDGEPLEEGDLLVQEDLAETFRLIAEQGTDVFYGGEIGEALAEEVQKRDSSMTSEDLSRYDVTHEEPVWGDYRGYDIASMAPPSSGGLTMLQMLEMFEEMDLTQYGIRSAEKYHHMAEVMHLAYADRGAYMGDPEFVDVPAEGLLHPDYIDERVGLIDPDQANDNVQPGNPWDYQEGEPSELSEKAGDKTNGETTHFTVADREGNLVSYTTTIEQVFGSGIMVPGYGIMLNNELTDFDAVPGGANEVEPNKRPLSSMTPTIVLQDGEPFMTVGSPGGTTIITSVMQTIVNVIGYDMALKDAIEEPRIFSSSYPSIRWESGIPSDVREQLALMGHEWRSSPGEIGNVNSLLIDSETGLYFGAADSTREGKAIGISADELPPDESTVAYLQYLSDELADEGEFNDGNAIRQVNTHLSAVAHYENSEDMEKAIKHLNGFKTLLAYQLNNDLISEAAYEELMSASDNLLDEWE
ncbi:gamma-glutamyltranspeptidase / glutathione hydrolase [Lentibacillus halodurans]|uniref:Glutathione hydrolase proenzyme n=2 Tax=Lentibacillus halodurans TaxID=237679 RepID=A0A1I0XHN3_9BACI|nr:gamma-glutamyltransferase [Lentibacillus halodurans]SFA99748.1 gamma-glutamyltranspeptidase / glutathione hydrolase [Lentibacillus halodurans]